MDLIRFSQPQHTGHEGRYVQEALASPVWHGDGSFTKRATDWLVQRTQAPAALLTSSCTHALEMAAILLELGPGDEVVCPSFTFPSTVTAIALRGATPVLVDVDPDTFCIDPAEVRTALTSRTKAVFVVHYGGVAADVDALLDLLDERGIPLVEDNAHGLGAAWKGQPLGTFGVLGTQSWHDTKNITSGEGGALLVNDLALMERAEVLREKGTNRSLFLRGQVDKYTWTDLGSSYLLSEVSAAVLLAQMEGFDDIQERRHRVWETYARELAGWAEESGVRLMEEPLGCEQPAHMFWLMLPSPPDQTAFIDHLRARDIVAAFHYQALDTSPAGHRFARAPRPCPVSARAATQLVRLPLHADLTDSDLERIVAAVRTYRPEQ